MPQHPLQASSASWLRIAELGRWKFELLEQLEGPNAETGGTSIGAALTLPASAFVASRDARHLWIRAAQHDVHGQRMLRVGVVHGRGRGKAGRAVPPEVEHISQEDCTFTCRSAQGEGLRAVRSAQDMYGRWQRV